MFSLQSFLSVCRTTLAVTALGLSLGALAQAPATPTAPPSAIASAAAVANAATPSIKAPTGGVESNPYGLQALWQEGDLVAKTTLVILIIMSMGSWYVIVTKLVEQSRLGTQANAAAKSFWSAGTVRQGADTLKPLSAYRFIAEKGLQATQKHEGMLGSVDFNTWVTQGIERAVANVQSRSQDGLAVLATVGSTAPFVGLFGTVWGIYNALVKIGASGQASIDKVAGPVGEALIMTAIGLAVAVPAVLGYNWLVRRNKLAMERVREFAADLHAVLIAGPGKH